MAGADTDHPWWHAPWKFFIETVSGLAIFAVITSAAVGLNFLVQWLEVNGVDGIIIGGLKLAEYGLFFVDLALFARFLFNTLKRNWNSL